MSEYNYLSSLSDDSESIDDVVANEFDVLNDEIVKFTEGRGEIVYTVMQGEEPKIWFDENVMESCYFVDFISHIKNESNENIELTNRIACVSYNTVFPVLFNSPLAELRLSGCITCENAEKLRDCIKSVVATKSFKNSLLRAKRGVLLHQESSVYQMQVFVCGDLYVLFAAQYQDAESSWFGYVAVASQQKSAELSMGSAPDINSLKDTLLKKFNKDHGWKIDFNNPLRSLERVNLRMLTKLYGRSCEEVEIARKCKIVQTKLDQIIPNGTTIL